MKANIKSLVIAPSLFFPKMYMHYAQMDLV